ncbi:MAG TPA: BMP family ABC transporter substrate-binding protein [Rectinemataceae bacterium]|nr:BMP family ABC transporter substrate-binding protein [Rectinemataceae bacterium]
MMKHEEKTGITAAIGRVAVTIALIATGMVAATALGGCAAKTSQAPLTSVAVFIPGVVSGSPTYEELVAGVTKAVSATKGATMKVIEGGYNQGEWQDRLAAVAASGQFGLIVTSNPSMPELCAAVAKQFPKIRFLVTDGWLQGNPAIHTILYNQYEQAWIIGYLAGLVATTPVGGHKPHGMAAMVVGQHYPTLDRLIEPGFEAGLRAADPEARFADRVLGNWYDANKAAELAKSLIAEGADIILPIAGGAGQGVLTAAKEAGIKALWFDNSGYALAPGVVVGSAIARQDRLVEEKLSTILSGKGASLFGTAEVVSAAQGYIDFDDSGEAYKNLPQSIRDAMTKQIAALRDGSLAFPINGF